MSGADPLPLDDSSGSEPADQHDAVARRYRSDDPQATACCPDDTGLAKVAINGIIINGRIHPNPIPAPAATPVAASRPTHHQS